MAIQITNNVATLDIDFDGNGDQYSINKANITLEKSGDYVVIVDSGRVPAKEYKVNYNDVTSPSSADADDLYATILGYLNNGGGGDATAGNQLTMISELEDINTELDNISATDFATSAKQEEVKTKLDSIITNTDTNSTEAKQDTQITNQEDIISKLTSLDSKTYNINPKIDESPQELLRQIHSGIDILTEQQMLTNNLLKLILS
jgi:hypothetical protein